MRYLTYSQKAGNVNYLGKYRRTVKMFHTTSGESFFSCRLPGSVFDHEFESIDRTDDLPGFGSPKFFSVRMRCNRV